MNFLPKVLLLSAAVLMISMPAGSEPWKLSVDASFTLTQNAYSDNWTGGEKPGIWFEADLYVEKGTPEIVLRIKQIEGKAWLNSPLSCPSCYSS